MELPYHAGFNYFELDRTSDYWKQLPGSGGFGMHVGGDFPALELELWAIRE
jgi:type VI secretion system protein ImpJ